MRLRLADGSYCNAPDDNDFWTVARWVEQTYPTYRVRGWKAATIQFKGDPVTTSGSEKLLSKVEDMHDRYEDPSPDAKFIGLVCKPSDYPVIISSGAYAGLGGRGERPGNDAWASTFGDVVAHELGHNFNRMHAPSRGDPDCTNPDKDSIGPNYKDVSYAPGIGGVGYDGSQVYDPATTHDFMSYCDPQWVSLFVWQKLYSKLAPEASSAAAATGDFTPTLTGEPQEYLVASGGVIEGEGVYLHDFYTLDLPAGSDDAVGSGAYSLELHESDGTVPL